jgi:hypothetical protein
LAVFLLRRASTSRTRTADLHLVFTEAEMIEQDVSRPIAQHFVQGGPRRRRVERGVEKLLDPCRK